MATAVGHAQDKKDRPDHPYDQYVKWESLDASGKVVHTAEKVPAKQQATKAPTWIVDPKGVMGDRPKTARITDKDGKVFKFNEIKSVSAGKWLCIVDTKAP